MKHLRNLAVFAMFKKIKAQQEVKVMTFKVKTSKIFGPLGCFFVVVAFFYIIK